MFVLSRRQGLNRAINKSVRCRVEATGINRAELLQRAGHYKLPPGKTSILGLEAAGKIIEVHDILTFAYGSRNGSQAVLT